ncbi:MAG: Gfo/Idh/MocA family oxidoreductase [Martelella sp.]|uniref:Gfo/Idh/MocA family protein n=1 Tax=Martelella sp. TaxID=1969699 RepID=UPI00324200B1
MKMKAVLCGCGAMAKGWLRALQANEELRNAIDLVGLVDLDRATAEALAAEFDLGDIVIGTDLPDTLQRCDADLLFDVVVPAARHSVAATGLSHGCHVLSEKPLAASLEEARDLVRLAAETGKIHAIVQNRRFIPGIRRLRRAVADGLIGDLTGVHCDFFLGPHFGGFREAMDNVLLLDMAVHTLDAARFVSGATPLSVYCVETNPAGSWYAHGAAANAIYRLSGDAVLTYRGSWCAEGRPTSWEGRWRLVGARGMITWDGDDDFEVTIAGQEPGLLHGFTALDMPPVPDEGEVHGHASVMTDFIRAVLNGTRPETSSDDNIKSLAMVMGAIESARTGLPVDLQIKE